MSQKNISTFFLPITYFYLFIYQNIGQEPTLSATSSQKLPTIVLLAAGVHANKKKMFPANLVLAVLNNCLHKFAQYGKYILGDGHRLKSLKPINDRFMPNYSTI